MRDARRRQLAVLAALLVQGCLHDFTVPPDREAGVDVALHDLPDRGADSRGSDRGPPPDTSCPSPCVTTLTGHVQHAFANGPLDQAYFDYPTAILVQGPGDLLVADTSNNRVRRIFGGQVTTLAGDGNFGWVDGPAATAQLDQPHGLATDGASVYVTVAHGVRRIAGGQVTTFAGSDQPGFSNGPALDARFYQPRGLLSSSTLGLIVAEPDTWVLRQVLEGQVTLFAGTYHGWLDGPASTARFESPSGVAVDGAGVLYVTDSRVIRRIVNGQVDTFAGDQGIDNIDLFVDGPCAQARFSSLAGIAIDASGALIVADAGNNAIRRIANGLVTTVAGTATSGFVDGPGTKARFNSPQDVAVDGAVIYVADSSNNCIRRIE